MRKGEQGALGMCTFQFLYRIIRSVTEKAALSKEQKEVREGVL